MMIYRLTGGRWGESRRRYRAGGGSGAVAGRPRRSGLIAIPLLYPWPTDPKAVKTDVLAYYLNMPSFIVRSLIHCRMVGAAFSAADRRPRSARFAHRRSGSAVLWHHDRPVSRSTGTSRSKPPFVVVLVRRERRRHAAGRRAGFGRVACARPAEDPAIGDIGGLLLAFLLGITYVDFMASW